MRYENLTATENYTMIAKNLKKHFTDEPLAYMILEFLYDEALKFNSFGLLTEDMSFYCPVSRIIEMFDGNVSNKTVIEKIKIIEKRNFIKKTSAKILKRPNYYRINFEKIKEIARDKKITVCNEIPTELAEETSLVIKNTIVENQNVYDLKPDDHKESTELVISDFTKCPNKFLEIFSKDYNEMVLLLRLMNTMETFNNRGKLQDDTSFYLSLTKMVEMFKGNISKPTLLKHIKNLEKKGFVSKTKSNNPKQANYYIVNCEKINKLCDTKTRQVFEEDEIPQELDEETPVVEKNEDSQPIKEIKVVETKEEVVKTVEVATLQSVKEEMASYWNRIAKDFNVPSVRVISDSDVKKIKSIIKEFGIPSIRDFFAEIYKAVGNSEHLRGNNDRCWKIHFSFLTQKSSMEKLFNFAYQSHDVSERKAKALFDPSTYTKTELADIREIVAGLKRCKANGNAKFYGFYIQDLEEKYNIPEDVVTSELLENNSFVEIENEDIQTLN